MQYPGGERIELGDAVSIEISGGWQEARVVVLGATREHVDLDQKLIDWFGAREWIPPRCWCNGLKKAQPGEGAIWQPMSVAASKMRILGVNHLFTSAGGWNGRTGRPNRER
tara:strand:- start:277 stop:609 length:333 start_codon:yes stop_codon:yes gene_type:complete